MGFRFSIMKDFSDMLCLISPVNTATCTKNARETAIDIMVANRPNSPKYTYLCSNYRAK